MDSEINGVDVNSIFGRIVVSIKAQIKNLVDVYMVDNAIEVGDLTKWLTGTPSTTYGSLTALEFYDSLFNKSKTIEAIVLINLITYISNDIDDVAVSDGSTVEPVDLTNSMAAYSAAISKTKDIKLSNK